MGKIKITIRLEKRLLDELDRWVSERGYSDRGQAIQAAIMEKMQCGKLTRLGKELGKLDRGAEQALAEEWLRGEDWPEF